MTEPRTLYTTADHSEFDLWLAGELGPYGTLRALVSDLGEVESQLEPLQKERDDLRAAISQVVESIGERVELPGFGKLEITGASKVVSYDKKAIQEVINHLVEQGEGELAGRILACQKETMRVGSLRITREKADS